jgi:hypothetical protein
MANTRNAAVLFLGLALVMMASLMALPLLRAMPEPSYDLPQVLQPAPPQPLPPLSEHAKLHGEATYIHEYLSTHDTRWCKFDCGAKGTKYYCRIGDRVAFALVLEGVKTITAFWVNNDGYNYDPKDDSSCKPFINAVHP